MNHPLPNMLETTMAKIRDLVDVNTVVGNPITTPDGVTILPVSKVSFGMAGGGSDFVNKHSPGGENPFGGGTGASVKITPVAFLVIRGESVRVLPVATPPSTTADRLVEQIPDVVDKFAAFIDSRSPKTETEEPEEE